MKRIMNKKRILLIIGILSMFIIGSTFSYFQASISVENKFHCSEAKIYINEKFNPNDQWVPGEEKQKEVRFGNEGKIDAVLRVKFLPVLIRADGTADVEAAGGFQLNFADEMRINWVKAGDWYYYKKVLKPSEMTDITLKSVTISDQIGNDEHGILPDYSGAKYNVEITGELIQASLAEEAAAFMKWEMTPQVTEGTVNWK